MTPNRCSSNVGLGVGLISRAGFSDGGKLGEGVGGSALCAREQSMFSTPTFNDYLARRTCFTELIPCNAHERDGFVHSLD
jgi:hypothetical protein